MCTATWLSQGEGYQLFFNRDEARVRSAARPPEVSSVEGVRVIAPTDGEAGGTWLALNEWGLTVALLNGETQRDPGENAVSRGVLVRGLACAASAAEVGERLRALALETFRGFRLMCAVSLDSDLRVRVWGWNGEQLLEEEAAMPLASSSLGSDRAHQARRAVLQNHTETEGSATQALEAFHASHAPERGPWSPCVHREDVVTLSASHVRVDVEGVHMRYAAGSPCRTAFGPELSLARRRLPGAADGRAAARTEP